MPSAETGAKLNLNPTLSGASVYKAGAPLFCQKYVKRIHFLQYIVRGVKEAQVCQFYVKQ